MHKQNEAVKEQSFTEDEQNTSTLLTDQLILITSKL